MFAAESVIWPRYCLRAKSKAYIFFVIVQLMMLGPCSSGITAKKGVFGAFCFIQENCIHRNKSFTVI